MKAFFEHFAAILGAATLALLVVSVSHEYGYFSSVGRQFQTFLTTTDYLSNSVPYLPGILGIAWISVRFWKFEDKAPRKVTWIDAAIIVVSLVLGMIFLTLPLEFDVVTGVIIILGFFWTIFGPHLLPKSDLEEPLKFIVNQTLRLVVPLIVIAFVIGSAQAGRDLSKFDEPYGFRFKNEEGTQLRIFLRSFDKGVLLRNAVDDSMEFRKWDDVVAINKRVPDKSGPPICWLFGWDCGSRNMAGPP